MVRAPIDDPFFVEEHGADRVLGGAQLAGVPDGTQGRGDPVGAATMRGTAEPR